MSPGTRAALTIARKEVVETLRDRKTLAMMIVLPLLLYPLVFVGLSQLTLIQQDELTRQEAVIALSGGAPPAELLGALAAQDATRIVHVDDAREAVTARRARAGLHVHPATRAEVAAGGQGELTLFYDGSDDRSREAQRRVEESIAGWVVDVRASRLAAAALRSEFVDPVAVASLNVAPPARQGGWILGQILPMLVSFLMIGAAFYPAVDLTAGEKERGTLQTLLTAPIPPLAIVAGKFGAVVFLALLTGLMNLLSVGLVAVSIPLPDDVAADVSFMVAPGAVLLILLCMVMLGMMFGAIMMAVAVTARSFKDAQNYLTPLYLLCIFPLMLSSLPGVQLDATTAAAPVVNLALAIKQLLLGDVQVELLLVVFVSTLVWTALGLALAARVFSMESVLLGHDGVSALFRRRPRQSRRPNVPTLGEAVTLLAIVLVLLFYGSLALADAPLLALVHATQWLFLLSPAVVLVAALRLSPRDTFALRRPPARILAAAALAGSGLWVIALFAMQTLSEHGIVPVPGPQMEAFAEQLTTLGAQPGSAVLLYLGAALAPAVCEEALFRGVLLQALLHRVKRGTAVWVTAAVFALYHLNVYQLPTTFIVGVVLGALVVVSGSIWPAVVLHLLHNAAALTVQLYVPPEQLESPLLAAIVALPAIGLAVLWRGWRQPPPPTGGSA